MKKLFTFQILLLSVSFFADVYPADTLIFNSTILKDARKVLVFKPHNLNSRDSVSILYIPDGAYSDYYAGCISGNASIEPMLVVGIVSDRRNDLLYVNHASEYLSFILDELVPEIEKAYKIKSRILFGHSFGGGFTLFALHNGRGGFDKYIASSPTPIMGLTDTATYLRIDSLLVKDIKLYCSYGSEDMQQVRKWCRQFSDNLESAQFSHIRLKMEIFEGEDHNTSSEYAIVNGLLF